MKCVRLGIYMAVLTVSLLLTGCAQGSPGSQDGETKEPVDAGPYEGPPFAGSGFHVEHSEGSDGVLLDLDHISDGYIGISVSSDADIKLLSIKGEQKEQYNVPMDGTPVIFPLQLGDGTYSFQVMKNVSGKSYGAIYTTEAEVTLADEFQPYLRPNAYADYDESSECVRKASELALHAGDELGMVGAVYDYICANVKYDSAKAQAVSGTSGYMPVPDDTFRSGKGICFDYASLAAAMLRSQGIPVRIVFGDVSPDDVYHAWNMFWTKETGWVSVKFTSGKDGWNRLDLTFSANGADSSFIGDGTNYLDEHYY